MIKINGDVKKIAALEEIKNSQGIVEIEGAVHRLRDMGGFCFILIRTLDKVIQVVWDIENLGGYNCSEGDWVRAKGKVVEDKRSKLGFEIHGTEIEIVSAASEMSPVPINKGKVNLHMDNHLKYRPVVLRNPRERAVYKIQEGICRGFREFLTSQNFTEFHSPKIVAQGAEGGANIFKLEYFEKMAFLAQSPQFYKQAMVPVFGRVFEVGPVFRAEKHDTARHLNEYTSLDFEMGFIDSFYDIMNMEAAMLNYVLELLEKEYKYELDILNVTLPSAKNIPAIKFHEAKEIIAEKYNRPVRTYKDLEPDEERLLGKWAMEEHGTPFVFVTHYPSQTRPFYTMEDPENTDVTLSFDLLLNGLEITTGGQRIHDYDMQIAKMKKLDMDIDEFESYLMTHKYGTPPHGGLGLGLERLTMQLVGMDNIRFSTLFPRDINHLVP
ncbi:MAG: aspartate--tRNA(Asn) ligase [Eubacteriales bacterium]